MAKNIGGMSVTGMLHAAFCKPLHQRCVDISKLIDETSVKELHSLLPVLLENIFGFNNQPGWGLGQTTRQQYSEFFTLRHFLGPCGPLLKLVHKLLEDPFLKYEFPQACIPYPSQRMLEEGVAPALYADRIQFNQAGKPCGILLLNAFEFYFFHFAYFLVNPQLQKMSVWVNANEALYPTVLEEYLNYYLPLNGQKVQPFSESPRASRSPFGHQSPHHRQSPASAAKVTPTSARLPYASFLRSYISSNTTPSINIPPPEHTEEETWRSQIFLQVLVEFWLNQTSLDVERFPYKQSNVTRHCPGQWFGDRYQYYWTESFLPNSDHVRVSRMLVKHLHYFVNSARPEVVTSPYSSPVISPWDEFKRCAFPQLVQKRLYAFLRHAFDRWPLDSSFRLILETWLSFIQPWRYIDPSLSNRERDPESKDKNVDMKWKGFVEDNLLFYTVLLQHFLQRSFRMDLSSPKNAYMLFRVTKVFNLPGLREMIEDAEAGLFDPMARITRTVAHGNTDVGASYLMHTSHHSNMVAMATHHFAELEGPGFQYKRMFSEDIFYLVQSLIALISQAKVTAKALAQKASDNGSGSFLSWLGLGPSVDYNATKFYSYDGYDDIGGRDSRKVEGHLDQSIANLCSVFQMDPPGKNEKSVTWGDSNKNVLSKEGLAPDTYETDDGTKLSPLGRYQMMNGLRKFDISFQGDPDLQPIRSFENAMLVRILHDFSSYLNEKFADELQSWYAAPGLAGKLARKVLHVTPGVTRDTPANTTLLTPDMEEPRAKLSLRWLGRNQNFGYVLAVLFFLYMWWGISPMGLVFMILVFIVVCVLLKTVMSWPKKMKTG